MKKTILWVLAIVITLTASIYQRKTGPTYPKELRIEINGKPYDLKLVRSLSLDEESGVKLAVRDTTIKARLYYKRFNTTDEYTASDFSLKKDGKEEVYFASLPQQPPAGKLQYYIGITDSNGERTLLKECPVVIRFKGSVPAFILIPHILFMFVAMLFSNLAGIMSIVKFPQYKIYGLLTLIMLTLGGMILGPIVQYYAFGELWTGIPFGWDLTDNKTLIAFIFWIIAVVMNWKKDRPVYTTVAALVLLLIYSIPHSLFGSQLDYSSGKVTQG